MALVNIRKLVALDIAGLGPRFILAEFSIGVILLVGLGVLSLRTGLFRTHSTWQALAGAYFLLLALNYIPLLIYAISIVHKRSAAVEVGKEIQDRARSFRTYRRQSLILLVPLAVPIAILMQQPHKH